MVEDGIDLSTLVGAEVSLPRATLYRLSEEEWHWWSAKEEARLIQLKLLARVPEVSELYPTAAGFCVPKKEVGVYRMVVDLRPLNCLTPREELVPPLPRLEDALPALAMSSRMVIVDIKDAFYSLSYAPTRPDLRRFGMKSPAGEERIYELKALAMGWRNSPSRLVKLTEGVLQEIRSWPCTVLCLCYLDDIIVTAATKKEGRWLRKKVLELLKRLGFSLKDEDPPLTDCATYVGVVVDLNAKQLRVTKKKVQTIRTDAENLLKVGKACARWVSLSRLRSFVGKAQNVTMVIQIGRVYLRHLYDAIHSTQQFWKGELKVKLDRGAQADLEWWTHLPPERANLYYRPFIQAQPSCRVWYDASLEGFGIVIESAANSEQTKDPEVLAGKWRTTQRQEHITSLEARAGFYALEAYVRSQSLKGRLPGSIGTLVELVGDSFSVVSAFTKQTSPSSDVMRSIRKLSSLQLVEGIWLQHAWVPTTDNKADWPSRLRLEESYKFRFAHRLARTWNVELTIDRFASYYNKQTPRYNSLLRSPGSEGSSWEAVWTGDNQFFNPPFSQISRVLHKMIVEGAGGILIVPAWALQPWYPLLRHLQIDKRILYHDVPLYSNEAGDLLPSPKWGTWALRVLPN
jgi:hypothetical protein